MTLPRRLLVPFDFSHDATAALDYALDFASKLGGEVHVLYVCEVPELPIPDVPELVPPPLRKKIEQAAEAALAQLIARKRPEGVRMIGHVLSGDARKEIGTLTKALDIDLIFLGAHGRGGASPPLLGTVAAHTSRFSKVSVLTTAASPCEVEGRHRPELAAVHQWARTR